MTFYELINEIVESSKQGFHCDNLPFSFNQSNRAKLVEGSDIEMFDLAAKAYEVIILYRSDRGDNDKKRDYMKNGGQELIPFTNDELELFNSFDWTKLPHNLKAHVYDVIWLCNGLYTAAKTAAEEYYELYHEWFDEEDWVQCVDYISRAVELVAKLGIADKKKSFLCEVYDDIVRLNGDDSSLLTVSLIELIIKQDYQCDINALIPFLDRLISKNEGNISTAHIAEQAYFMKAKLYKKMKDFGSSDAVYVQYADTLMSKVDEFVNTPNNERNNDNRNWFMAVNDVMKAIELFQNHGASEKAIDAQKRLVEIQKESVKHIEMHTFKFDASESYQEFCNTYGNHSIDELVWDVVFAFGFQNKQKIREEVTKKPSITSMFSMHMLGSEGQTEFMLPGLKMDDEDNILLHMYHRARDHEKIQGETFGVWFIRRFRELGLQEADLDPIFENNPIIPKGQEKDVQRGVYYGLTGNMSDALDKLAPKVENIIRNLAEICGDLMTYFDVKEGVQQKRTLSQVFTGEKLNECIDENVLFTFDGLLQQKAGSNIRNRIGHGLNTEAECSTGDCIYFVLIVLKFCAMHCDSYVDESVKRTTNGKNLSDNG